MCKFNRRPLESCLKPQRGTWVELDDEYQVLPETRIFAERNSDVTPDPAMDDPLIVMMASAVDDEPAPGGDSYPDQQHEEKYETIEEAKDNWDGVEQAVEMEPAFVQQAEEAEGQRDEPQRRSTPRARRDGQRGRRRSPPPRLAASEPARSRCWADGEKGTTSAEMDQARAFIMLYVETVGVNPRWRWGHDQRNALEAEANNHTPRIRIQISTLVMLAKEYVASRPV